MLPTIKDETIKTLSVPVEWVVIEGSGGRNISDLDAVGLYRAFLDVSDPLDTSYAKIFGALFRDGTDDGDRTLRNRIEKLRHDFENKDSMETPVPAKLNANGTFELLDGHHRCADAIARGMNVVDLDIKYVSPLWSDLESRILSIYGEKKLYQRIEHPWFNDWHVARTDDRGNCILNYIRGMSFTKRNSVDIGCCTGRLSRLLRAEGFNAYGFDRDPNVIHVADHLNMVFGSNVNFTVFGDIETMVKGCGMAKTNVVVCLSVLHHYLWEGTPQRYLDTIKMLLENSNVLFFDHLNEEDRSLLKTDEVPLGVQGLIDWIREMTGFSVVQIGEFEERPLFASAS